jgi:fucose permease
LRSGGQSSRPRGRELLGLIFLAFVSLGLPDGLLGVAWPSMRRSFALPPEALGSLLVPFTASYVLASFASGAILSRITVGDLLAASCLATGVSLMGYALSPVWSAVVVCAALAGLGAGAIDAGVNSHVALHHGPRTLNWMHAAYGVGAASGPLIMAAVLASERKWQVGYGIVAIAQLLLAEGFTASRSSWPPVARATATTGRVTTAISTLSTLRFARVWLGLAAFFFYTGLEAIAGIWMYSYLTSVRSVPMAAASSGVTLYWTGLTAGRVLFGASVERASLERRLRQTSLVLAAAAGAICLTRSAGASIAAFALFGLAAGPVFPSLMATTPDRVQAAHVANAVGFQVAAAALGQSLLPTLAGLFARGLGLGVVGPMLLTTVLFLLVIHEALVADYFPPRQGA